MRRLRIGEEKKKDRKIEKIEEETAGQKYFILFIYLFINKNELHYT